MKVKYWTILNSFIAPKIFLILLFFVINSYAQEDFVIPDSLKKDNFLVLRNKISKWYLDRKSKELEIYTNTYLKRALQSKHSVTIAEGYGFMSYTVYGEPKEEDYIDKAIAYSKDYESFYMPSMAYYTKAGICADRNDFKGALDYFLLAHDAAIKGGNIDLASQVKYNIGILKNRIGAYDEALVYGKERWDYVKSNKLSDSYLSSLFLLSVSYSYTKKLDSASSFNQLGIRLATAKKNKSDYHSFVLLEGVNQYFKQNYTVAIDSLNKALVQLKKDKDNKNIASSYMYLAKSYRELDNNKIAFNYLKKMDSIFNVTNHLLPYTRDGYKILIAYAENKNNLKEQLYYTNQLLRLDSILDSNYKYLNTTIYKKLESVELVKEKEKLIQKLGIKNNAKTKDTITKVLENLDLFEEKEGFLKPNITVTVLAKKVNTNPKYLSKIINFYKQKSTTNYINDLRIHYAIERIKKDTTFRKYSIKSIANEVGYANPQAFSNAFYKETGLKPSYFIKEVLKKQKIH